MNLTSSCTNLRLKRPHTLFFPPNNHFQILQFRVYKRRRIKPSPKLRLTVLSHVGPSLPSPFENLLQTFVSQFPSLHSPDFLAPAIGFASGVALYLGWSKPTESPSVSDFGEWIMFTSPTPFNRFVLLRCPSISFEGSELLEDVNEKLVKEDRHFVRLNSGRIQARSDDGIESAGLEEKLEYQRLCLGTEDGGVISLDWPANLDLKEEHGLDTTLLVVPGTVAGSTGKNVRRFVCEALRRGVFPVVMNPRGCAGSPLTTARLFTAADSDDICTAIQFISEARPWTTLMGVGWGYGANMLTKYLAEVGERTPLTAATCIDNPFDLEEATRSSPHSIALDQKLTDGLIDILRSNKELFQGRAKGFDVEKALLAKSVRDFEKAISMVSYGFETLEDFYSKSSTRGVIGNVKIPVLFIQNDDGTVPLSSIPRSLIAENPFTSLLLCSCLPSSVTASGRAAVSWCQHLTIEWLTAVELGLLKGRHPLLNDVDVTINLSKGLALVEGRPSDKGGKVNKLLDLTRSNSLNGHLMDPMKEMLEENKTAASIYLKSRQDLRRNLQLDDKGLQDLDNGALQPTSSVDAELVKEEEASPVDSERGQVLQTAEVVMNMVDLTMPGTLSDEEKKKVLIAVGQGETLMKALQDAVPEDVRGKLTAAVSGIMHAQGTNLNFDGLLGIGRIGNVPSSAEGLHKDPHHSDQIERADNLADGSDDNQPDVDMPAGGKEWEHLSSENLQNPVDLGQSQSVSSHQGDISSLVRNGSNESANDHENDEFIKEKAAPFSEFGEKGSETGAKPNFTSQVENGGGTEEAIVDEHKVDKNGGVAQLDTKEANNTQKNEEKTMDSSSDQNNMKSASIAEAVLPQGSSPEAQATEREGNDNQKRENKILQPVHDQNPTTFSVSQALDALTEIDDSTQVAVNSVFGVIENMISQLEGGKDDENEVKDWNEVKDENIESVSKKQHIITDHTLEEKEDNKNDQVVQSDTLRDPPVLNSNENGTDSKHDTRTRWVEEEPTQNPISLNGNDADSQGNNTAKNVGMEKEKRDQLVGSNLLYVYSDRHVNSIPLCITVNPYGLSVYNQYFRRYLLSKMMNTKPLDLDTTTALLLDYFPEEGQWKLLEQPGNIGDSISDVTINKGVDRKVQAHSPAKVIDKDNFIEPAYVILDTEKQQEPVGGYETMVNVDKKFVNGDDRSEELMQYVKNIILDSLRVEVGRRLSASDMKELESSLARDIELVANAVALAVRHDEKHTRCLDGKDYHSEHYALEKVGTLHAEHIIRAISTAVQGTNYLRRVLPVGVIVGSSLASLRKDFNVATVLDNVQREAMMLNQTKKSGEKIHYKASLMEIDQMLVDKTDQNISSNSVIGKEEVEAELKNLNNDSVMVGAVTAALGASALLVRQQDQYKGKETAESLSKSFKEKGNNQKESHKLDEAMSDKNHYNIVTSLAEKAMSVAGPVVPTKEDGEVDQERLVAMLADLGQKGGMLRLVGKIALLWGGLRGAMSLTDKLILFLHLAERPLFYRILGFVGMVLVVWSPVVVPLLPTLVQSWMTNNPSRIAELACIIGFYTAVMILVMLWGRRVREYENPLEQYGLDLTSSTKIQNFLKGLVGGVMLVLSIQSVNALLGCVSFSWPSSFPSSLDPLTWIKMYGKMLVLAGRGIVMATGVVLVEELLFRSWLPQEIATDFGYHQGIIMSGLAFSLFQRSPVAIPGLWLLSLALSGARQRSQGSLSIPIGLRSGIMASSSFLQTGGFLTYKPNTLWVTGTHPFQPFSGLVGLTFSLLLAIFLYPRPPLLRKKLKRTT